MTDIVPDEKFAELRQSSWIAIAVAVISAGLCACAVIFVPPSPLWRLVVLLPFAMTFVGLFIAYRARATVRAVRDVQTPTWVDLQRMLRPAPRWRSGCLYWPVSFFSYGGLRGDEYYLFLRRPEFNESPLAVRVGERDAVALRGGGKIAVIGRYERGAQVLLMADKGEFIQPETRLFAPRPRWKSERLPDESVSR